MRQRGTAISCIGISAGYFNNGFSADVKVIGLSVDTGVRVNDLHIFYIDRRIVITVAVIIVVNIILISYLVYMAHFRQKQMLHYCL